MVLEYNRSHVWCPRLLILALKRKRKANLYEFEVSLVHITNSRQAKVT